ncbi:tigger transposable element-derived protein 1-like isoform 1-T3 [Pholidichthys leucotaenia]
MRLVDLAKEYGRNTSTISTVLKQKEALKAVTPSKGLSVISKRRSAVNDEMERLLLVWIKEKEIAGDTVTEAIICEKATAIFNDLVKEDAGEGTSAQEIHQEFKASRGWFEKFKKRSGIHSVVRHGEACSADRKAADEFVQKFQQLVSDEGYVAQQVFNCDETGLFWKKMPRRTFITVEEKKMPGHKPMKDRLTLALCANASGDCKINKPLLVYHSENPRAFKAPKILKEEEEEAAIMPTARIKEILGKFHEVSEFVEKNHPEKVFTSRAIAHYDDVCLAHFRRIVTSRQKQTSLDRFFTKRQAKTTDETEHEPKKAKGDADDRS